MIGAHEPRTEQRVGAIVCKELALFGKISASASRNSVPASDRRSNSLGPPVA